MPCAFSQQCIFETARFNHSMAGRQWYAANVETGRGMAVPVPHKHTNNKDQHTLTAVEQVQKSSSNDPAKTVHQFCQRQCTAGQLGRFHIHLPPTFHLGAAPSNWVAHEFGQHNQQNGGMEGTHNGRIQANSRPGLSSLCTAFLCISSYGRAATSGVPTFAKPLRHTHKDVHAAQWDQQLPPA